MDQVETLTDEHRGRVWRDVDGDLWKYVESSWYVYDRYINEWEKHEGELDHCGPFALAEEPDVLCPFCNHSLAIGMFNGTYGCDTGCSYVRFTVECPGCNKTIYHTGTFGEFEDHTEQAEYREEFMAEFAKAVQEINAKKAQK